ncbi:MAG TPA: hypothetical protein VF288_09530 [Mycobacteriales bacterium]
MRYRQRDPLDALARRHGVDPSRLRDEVAGFRLALDTDLTLAAAAVGEDQPALAAEALAADRAALTGFEEGLRSTLADVARARRGARRRRVVGVAALAGLVSMAGTGALAATSWVHAPRPQVAAPAGPSLGPAQRVAVSQADTLAYAAAHRLPTATVLAASQALQSTLVPLLPRAAHDPALSAQLRALLTEQRTALTSLPTPDAQVEEAIRAAESLLARLPAVLPTPGAIPTTVQPSGRASSRAPTTAPVGTGVSTAPSPPDAATSPAATPSSSPSLVLPPAD